MRVRSDVEPITQQELGRAHLIEENERTYHLSSHGGQRPSRREAADVAGPRHDQGLDAPACRKAFAAGIGIKVTAHGRVLLGAGNLRILAVIAALRRAPVGHLP